MSKLKLFPLCILLILICSFYMVNDVVKEQENRVMLLENCKEEGRAVGYSERLLDGEWKEVSSAKECECPYPEGSQEYYCWLEGYQRGRKHKTLSIHYRRLDYISKGTIRYYPDSF